MDQVRVLTARRAYEFRPDDLRLSVLSTPHPQELVQQFFSFQVAQIGAPLQTFGLVPLTNPPGIVFNYGVVSSSETDTLIRFLHFEPYRIVIDLAGPSSTIDQVYDQLQQVLVDVRDYDESPAIGKFTRALDYTEISVHLSFDFEKLLNEPLNRLAQSTFGRDEENLKAFPASIEFLAMDPSQEIQQAPPGPSLQVRAGTRLEDRIYFSMAYLPLDKHIAWLEALDTQFG